MRKILLISLLSLFTFALYAQNVITGVVKRSSTSEPIEGVSVKLVSSEYTVLTAQDGSFVINSETIGADALLFTGAGIINYQLIIDVKEGSNDVGEVLLKVDENADMREDIMLSITEEELDAEGSTQKVSGLLTSRGDVFSSNASYNFSSMRFRIRGLDGRYNQTYLNGILMNDVERGYFSYSQIGGLNDMVRSKESISGSQAASFAYSGIGGAENINARASAIRKGLKIGQVLSNRTYITRTMITYGTGMMNNGWAFAASASYRWANAGYVEGTFYNAGAFAFAAEKRINMDHSLSLTLMGAPTNRGQQAGSTQDVYELTPKQTFFRTTSSEFGNNFYNPNWGYQNGKMRNAKQVKSFTPIAILSHEWKITNESKLTTSVGYKYQMDGRTALNWYRSADPRPDYYRNLPNYYVTMGEEYAAEAELRTDLWQNDESYRQIQWDKLYQTNYLAKERGLSGRYLVENKRNDQHVISANSVINYRFNEEWKFDGGVELQGTIAEHYKLVDDLLGADYWLDIDQYGERDNPGDADFMQNDLNNKNRKVVVGDRFGYDYKIYSNSAKIWGQATHSGKHHDVYFAAHASYSNFWRVGNMKNGRAAGDSLMYSTLNGKILSTSWGKIVDKSNGYSPIQNYITYGIKAGANYRITGRHILTANIAFGTNPQLSNNVYFSERIKSALIPQMGLTPEMYLSADLSYYIKTPIVSGRVSVYNTNFWNATDLSSYYNDEYNTYINVAMYNFSKRHTGAELGLEFNVGGGFSIQAVAAVGQYVYTSDPRATISYENGLQADTEVKVYAKGFHIDGTPEVATTLGLHYFHPKYWFVDVNVNYFTNSYIDFNQIRRSEIIRYDDDGNEMLTGIADCIRDLNPDDNAELIDRITKQERLKGGVTVDVSVGKSISIHRKYYLNINLSASNILNNTKLKTGGFEQSRFSYTNSQTSRETYLNRFSPKYFYAYGATIYLNMSFRF